MTTTNGTRAILASLEAERVYIAGFVNLQATSDELAVQFLKKDRTSGPHRLLGDRRIHQPGGFAAGRGLGEERRQRDGPWIGNANSSATTRPRSWLSQWLEVDRYLEQRPLVAICWQWGAAARM